MKLVELLDYAEKRAPELRKAVVTTFTFDPRWFGTVIYRKYLTRFAPGSTSVLFQRMSGNYSPDARLYGRIQLFAVSPKSGLFHPKIFAFDFPDAVAFGLGSVNLTSSGYTPTALELQHCEVATGSRANGIRALLAGLHDAVAHDGLRHAKQEKNFAAAFEPFLAHRGKPIPKDLVFGHGTTKETIGAKLATLLDGFGQSHVKRVTVLSPFYTQSGVVSGKETAVLQLPSELPRGLVTLVEILCREMAPPAPPAGGAFAYEVFDSNSKDHGRGSFHAKATVLEVASAEGIRFVTVFGSSNFSVPAWQRGNVEIDRVVVSTRDPLAELRALHFRPIAPPAAAKTKGSDIECEVFVQHATLDVAAGTLSYELSGRPDAEHRATLCGPGDALIQIESLRRNDELELANFEASQWIKRGQGPILQLRRGSGIIDECTVLLIGVASMASDDGEVIPPPLDGLLDMLSSGRYVPPPPLPIDEGSGEDPGEDEEDPEDDVDLLVWFELGDVNDHEALSNRVARYVRPVAERVLAAMPHENTDLDRELELLRFVTRSIKQKLSGRSDTRIYTVLVEAIRLALFGVLSSYRTRSEVERTNLGKLRIALSTTLNSHFQTDSGARRKVQENG